MKNPAKTPEIFAGNKLTSASPRLARRSFLRSLGAIGLLPLAGVSGLATDRIEWPSPDDPHYWSWIRSHFSIPEDEAYFNTGTIGACPKMVINAVVESMRLMESTIAVYDYRAEHKEYIAGYRPQNELRAKAGALINADGKDIALTQNATMGINFIANGLELKPGDEILVTDQEHPGAIGPWDLRAKRQGIVVKQLAIPIPATDSQVLVKIFADAIGPRTKVIAVPHITSRQGIVMPVREICRAGRERGVFTLVDGAQALGHVHVDVKEIGCDACACSPHKWLLAPPGNGMLYVKPDLQSEIWATLASAQWNNYTAADGIFRLMQFGTANAALLDGFDAAIDFHSRIGAEKIQMRILTLANRLRNGLSAIKGATITSPTNPELAGAIVTYGVAGVTGQQLMDELWARKKFRVRAQTDKLVRQSVHFYNSPEEIDATLEIVTQLAKA